MKKAGARAPKRRSGREPGQPRFEAEKFFDRVRTKISTRNYLKKQTVFAQGDPADAVFYIESGAIKLTVVSTTGKEAVIALLEPGQFVGESSLAGRTIRIATATAIQPSRLIRIPKEAMIHLLHSKPAYAQHFTACLLSRNLRVEEDLVDQLFNSSEKRLARLLLLLAHYGKDSKREPVAAKLSQETLAEMIGTTRSRVSYFLNRFRKMGLIDYKGGLHVNTALLTVVLRDKF